MRNSAARCRTCRVVSSGVLVLVGLCLSLWPGYFFYNSTFLHDSASNVMLFLLLNGHICKDVSVKKKEPPGLPTVHICVVR